MSTHHIRYQFLSTVTLELGTIYFYNVNDFGIFDQLMMFVKIKKL